MKKRTLWMAAAIVVTLIIAVVLFRFAKTSTIKPGFECVAAGSACNWGEGDDTTAPKPQPLITVKK